MSDVTATIEPQALTAMLSALTVLEHNNLDGLQGGSVLERYHTTEAQNTNVVGLGTLSQQDADDVTITGGSLSNIASIMFDLIAAIEPDVGELAWDANAGTLTLGMPGGVVKLNLGQEQYINMRNDTGDTILQPKAVYISGAIGKIPTIGLLANTDLVNGAAGLTTENILNNANGKVATFGLINDVDTSDWEIKDSLFVDSVAGELTNVAPTGNARTIFVGFVLVKNANNGVIFCSIRNLLFPGELSGDAPTVTGSRGGNAALASLLSELDGISFIVDNTTA